MNVNLNCPLSRLLLAAVVDIAAAAPARVRWLVIIETVETGLGRRASASASGRLPIINIEFLGGVRRNILVLGGRPTLRLRLRPEVIGGWSN